MSGAHRLTVRFADSAQRAVLCGQCNVHSAEAIACELWARSEHAHVTTCHVVGASKISTSAITASMEIEASGGDRGKWSNFSYVGILKGSFSLRSDTLAPATLSRGRFLSMPDAGPGAHAACMATRAARVARSRRGTAYPFFIFHRYLFCACFHVRFGTAPAAERPPIGRHNG